MPLPSVSVSVSAIVAKPQPALAGGYHNAFVNVAPVTFLVSTRMRPSLRLFESTTTGGTRLPSVSGSAAAVIAAAANSPKNVKKSSNAPFDPEQISPRVEPSSSGDVPTAMN